MIGIIVLIALAYIVGAVLVGIVVGFIDSWDSTPYTVELPQEEEEFVANKHANLFLRKQELTDEEYEEIESRL